MAKTYLKEAGIVILLILAVALLLAIIFYDYIPNNKVVPIKLQEYTMPEDIKEELGDTSVDEQNIVRTYYIDSTDLDLYESTNDYNKGKANPFADYSSKSGSASSKVTNSTSANSANVKSSDTTNNNSTNTNNTNTNINSSDPSTSDDGEVYMTKPGKNY